MADILQVPVPVQNPALVWPARQAPGINTLLLINTDVNNTVYIGQQSSITAGGSNTVPVPPNGSLSVDPGSSWYVIGAAAGISPLVMVPNGQSTFRGLTQGQGKLALPAFQNPGYIPGVAGWQITQDGDAEFNSLRIRGTFFGTDFELNSNGLFFYSGTPASGNLIGSWAQTAGTDEFGNAYAQGICIGAVSNTEIQIRPDLDGIFIYSS